MTKPVLDPADSYPVTERSRVRREHERARYDRATVHAVLDAQPLCHVGYVMDGAPYVTPTLQWREGERIYWHGSSASRFLERAANSRVCLTVSLMDGYVMARSAYSHSINYRSVMAFGRAQLVEGREAKARALEAMVETLFPGRWASLRPMTEQELKATAVLFMDIEEAVAKVRTGPPGDPEEAHVQVWAGVIPLRQELEAPQADPASTHDLPVPQGLLDLVRSGRLRPETGEGGY